MTLSFLKDNQLAGDMAQESALRQPGWQRGKDNLYSVLDPTGMELIFFIAANVVQRSGSVIKAVLVAYQNRTAAGMPIQFDIKVPSSLQRTISKGLNQNQWKFRTIFKHISVFSRLLVGPCLVIFFIGFLCHLAIYRFNLKSSLLHWDSSSGANTLLSGV